MSKVSLVPSLAPENEEGKRPLCYVAPIRREEGEEEANTHLTPSISLFLPIFLFRLSPLLTGPFGVLTLSDRENVMQLN